jgi:hypothetical protein
MNEELTALFLKQKLAKFDLSWYIWILKRAMPIPEQGFALKPGSGPTNRNHKWA